MKKAQENASLILLKSPCGFVTTIDLSPSSLERRNARIKVLMYAFK